MTDGAGAVEMISAPENAELTLRRQRQQSSLSPTFNEMHCRHQHISDVWKYVDARRKEIQSNNVHKFKNARSGRYLCAAFEFLIWNFAPIRFIRFGHWVDVKIENGFAGHRSAPTLRQLFTSNQVLQTSCDKTTLDRFSGIVSTTRCNAIQVLWSSIL